MNRRRLLLLGLALGGARTGLPDEAPAPTVVLEAPRAGWRDTAGEPTGFVQRVQYPASNVNVEEAHATALIQGRVSAAPKGPATLVVNGVPMPLRVEDDGTFARPYSFATGSNSVEVRAGDVRTRRQFYELGARSAARLRVLLSWDSDGTDVDLHVVGPTGEHTFYADRVSPSGGALDVDVTTGYGPEIFAHPNPPPGLYHVYVNFYGAGEVSAADLTVTQIAILTAEGTLKEKREVFAVPLRKPGELTLVRSFVYP